MRPLLSYLLRSAGPSSSGLAYPTTARPCLHQVLDDAGSVVLPTAAVPAADRLVLKVPGGYESLLVTFSPDLRDYICNRRCGSCITTGRAAHAARLHERFSREELPSIIRSR